MKLLKLFVFSLASLALAACATDGAKSSYLPQKMIQAVNAKYPTERTNLIYIPAPEGFIAPREATNEVVNGVDSGKVVVIITALTTKTSTLVITGTDDSLTAATLERALSKGDAKISGGKIIYFGGKESLPNLSKLATNAGVTIEFMDIPS